MHRPITTLTEAELEQTALSWLSDLGWRLAHGADIAPETPNAERADYGQVVLERRLRDARMLGLESGALGVGNAIQDTSRRFQWH